MKRRAQKRRPRRSNLLTAVQIEGLRYAGLFFVAFSFGVQGYGSGVHGYATPISPHLNYIFNFNYLQISRIDANRQSVQAYAASTIIEMV